MKKLLSIIFLSFFSMSANADDQQTFVFNNLQGDFTTCYSYYLLFIVITCYLKKVSKKVVMPMMKL